MDNKEQIEEMAKEIFNGGIAINASDLAYGLTDDDDHFHRLAKYLYAAGYRKTFTSELASDMQKAYKEGYIKACNENADEIGRLKSENANLIVENEVLQSEKENLMRKLEEGEEEIESARKETAKEIYEKAEFIINATSYLIGGKKYLHLDALKEIVNNI